jgi:hypothetical protein
MDISFVNEYLCWGVTSENIFGHEPVLTKYRVEMTEVVGLSLPGDTGAVAWFEVDDDDRWHAASGESSVVGRLEESLEPLLAAARMVLDKARAMAPDEVEVSFGAKLSGEVGWVFSKATAEGNLTVTLRWKADSLDSRPSSTDIAAVLKA